MLNIVICDDEKVMRNTLRKVIERELQLKGLPYTIEEYVSGENLLEKCQIPNADIMFLDIEMKLLNGIETAKKVRATNKKAVIVFVTAFPDFVFQGYEVRALNYILKPYEDKKIIEVLQIALEDLDKLRPLYYAVKQKSGNIKITLNDTYYFMSEKRRIIVKTKLSNIDFYAKLDEVEQELPDFFIRIHNRYLVNLNYITSLTASSVICSGEELPVSRQYKQALSIAFAKNILR